MPRIEVHEKVLAHLSRGLYRSPASALRELVSNAWDANATVVQVDTNYPHFLQLRVQDNGDGFTKEDFASLMQGGIGNSDKRSEKKELRFGRSIIGRLGIGMLGIAQITGSFTVASKTKDNKGFRAKVQLYDLIKEGLDANDPKFVRTKEVDLGTYDFEPFRPDNEELGTTILADDIHPTFAQSFQESLRFEKFKSPPLDWTECLKIVSKVHSLQELGDYWRLIWELAAACPVPYVGANALPKALIKDDQKRLESNRFSLMVDGRRIAKPVSLRGNEAGYTCHKIQRETRQIYGKTLAFHGYVAVQEGSQLHPDELRGILLRIKDVAIGYYDPSLLDYRTNEGPRSRWLTGEIFVEQGLEDALNVDRDSFNRVHPEFRAIQEYVHSILKGVFSDVWRNIDVRSNERKKLKDTARRQHLGKVISHAVESKVAIKSGAAASKHETPEVVVDTHRSKTDVVLPPAGSLKTKRSNRELAAAILALFEVSMREKTTEKRKAVFTDLLLELLAKW